MGHARALRVFRYGILLCILATSIQAQEPPSEFKTLHFPPDHHLGRIYLWPSEYRNTLPIDHRQLKIYWNLQHKTCLGLAQGDIQIPRDRTILLDLPTGKDTQYLTALGPNDIHTLSVPKVSDKDWPSIAHLTGLQILKITSFQNSKKGMANLAQLTNLKALILEHNYAGKTLAKLPPLPQLEYLDIFITPGRHFIGAKDADLQYLDKFPGLKDIKIFMHRMDGSGLVHLKQLPRLERLCLVGSGALAGERLPAHKGQTHAQNRIVHDLSALKDLTQLKRLILWEFTFPDPYELLSHMTELETFNLIRVYGIHSKGFHHLAQLKHLKHVEFLIKGDQNLTALKTMTQLERVSQVYVPEDPNELAFLRDFPHLKSLVLGTAARPGELKFLENFTHLPSLSIGCDPFHHRQEAYDFKPLRSLTQLESLDLGGIDIKDADLAFLTSLSQLKKFSLMTNYVGDQSLQYMSQLFQLERVELDGCMEPVTVTGLNQLKRHSHLTHLIIHGGSHSSESIASDTLPLDLSGCPNLEELTLQSIALRDEDLAWLTGHQNLHDCMIDTHKKPPMSSKVVSYFATLSQLRRLYLGRLESIDAVALEPLNQLRQLHYLRLTGDIDPESLIVFKDHPTLNALVVDTSQPVSATQKQQLKKALSPTRVNIRQK